MSIIEPKSTEAERSEALYEFRMAEALRASRADYAAVIALYLNDGTIYTVVARESRMRRRVAS